MRDTIKDLSLDEKINRHDGARIIISKQTGANTVQIAREVKAEMERIQKTLPPDIETTLIRDGSSDIVNAINGLTESIFYALLFVVLVVLVFLGNWRATVIIALTIPISLVTSFIYLLLADSSLNIISLTSLTVAIGMVVDDAIVVLENISKHIDRGENPREAAICATNEVWTSVIATTLVLVAVFVPLTMLPGMMGIFMKEMGWIITIVVCVSTTAAITLIPMLSSKMLKERPFFFKKEDEEAYQQKKERSFYNRTVIRAFNAIDGAYANLLRWCLRHKRVTLLIALAFFVVTLIPLFTGSIGMDFMKEQDNGQISITAELQRGTRIEETLKTARQMEDDVYRILGDEVIVVSTTAGSNDDAGFAALFNSTTNNKISMNIRTTKKYDRDITIFQMQEQLRQCFAEYPELVNYQVSQGGMGMGGQNSLSVEIYGYDFDITTNFTQQLKKRVEQNVPGARDTKVSRDEDRAELKITFDKQKLALHGLNGSTVALYVRNRVNGMSAGFLKEDGEEYNIVVRLREEYRSSISDIEQLSIPTPTGKIIKLEELAKVEEYWCPPTIERKNRQRYLTLTVMPYNTSLQELAQSVQHAHPHARLHRHGLAVRVLLQALHHHVLHPLRHQRRGAHDVLHRQQHRHGGPPRTHPPHRYRRQERYRARRLHQPHARTRHRPQRGHRPLRTEPSAPRAHDRLHHHPRHDPHGHLHLRGLRNLDHHGPRRHRRSHGLHLRHPHRRPRTLRRLQPPWRHREEGARTPQIRIHEH